MRALSSIYVEDIYIYICYIYLCWPGKGDWFRKGESREWLKIVARMSKPGNLATGD